MNILRSTGDTTVFIPFSILSQSWWLGWNHRIVRLKRIMEGAEARRGPPLWLSPLYLSLVWLRAPLHSVSNSPDLNLPTSGKTSLSTFHSPSLVLPLAPPLLFHDPQLDLRHVWALSFHWYYTLYNLEMSSILTLLKKLGPSRWPTVSTILSLFLKCFPKFHII